MKKLYPLLILMSLMTNLKAQSLQIGAKVGYNYSILRGKDALSTLKNNSGYHAGVFAEFPITAQLSIQPELLYTTGGGENVFVKDDKYQSRNIAIPMLVKYYLTKGFSVELGPQISFATNSRYKLNEQGANEIWKAVKSAETSKGMNFSGVAGVAYKIPFLRISLNARYVLGLNNIINQHKDNGLDAFFQDIKKESNLKQGFFMLGIGYGL